MDRFGMVGFEAAEQAKCQRAATMSDDRAKADMMRIGRFSRS
jgi:hypothetical protein